jgi:penicillin-insensitive murein endopeptidase
MRWALALIAMLAITPLAAQVADNSKTAAPAKAKPKPKKPLVRKEPAVPAKELFGAVKDAAPLAARAIGFYARGCIAGAKPLAIDGPSWQAMRLSRNRNWGHPQLVRMVEKLATEAKAQDGWNGLLVGDM